MEPDVELDTVCGRAGVERDQRLSGDEERSRRKTGIGGDPGSRNEVGRQVAGDDVRWRCGASGLELLAPGEDERIRKKAAEICGIEREDRFAGKVLGGGGRRKIVDRRDPQDVRCVERNARGPCHRCQHVVGSGPRAFQVEVQPLEHTIERVIDLARLGRCAGMADVAEVFGDRITRIELLQGVVHAQGFRQRKEIVREPLQLEHRQLRKSRLRVLIDSLEELLLPPDRAVAGDAVHDLGSDRGQVVRFGREDVRVPDEEVIGVVRIRAVTVPAQSAEEQPRQVAQLVRAGDVDGVRRITVRPQGTKQVRPGDDRHDRADPHRVVAGGVELRVQRGKPRLTAAI